MKRNMSKTGKRPAIFGRPASLFGIITIGAIIGFGLAGCPADPDDPGGGGGFIITGFDKGQALVYAVTPEPADLQAAMSAIMNPAGSGTIVSGAAVTWQITPPSKTYTIVARLLVLLLTQDPPPPFTGNGGGAAP